MEYVNNIIDRYKRIRSLHDLKNIYYRQYALVGFGNHCTSNLLPVMQYLQLPLKYICCTSERKAVLISQKYKDVRGTTTLQDVLNDDSIAGIFVATNPRAHFSIATEVIRAGKSLWIEKPPCNNSNELNRLIDTSRLYGAGHIFVGLQHRFAPATRILQKQLSKTHVRHYHYRYLTGRYPEGDALLDLFIHPLDYVTLLFGGAKVKSANRVGYRTLLLILEHRGATGMLELSTDYSWQNAKEELSISTDRGQYVLNNMEKLDFISRPAVLLVIPAEKIIRRNTGVINLYGRNGFVPTIDNNQLVAQGFFAEIETFADRVEHENVSNPTTSLEALRTTYALIDKIRDITNK